MEPPRLQPSPRGWRAYRAPLTLLVLLLVTWGLLQVFPLLQTVGFLAMVGLLLSFMLRYPIDLLSRWMPRGVATLLTVLALVGLVVLVIGSAVPLIRRQAALLMDQLPAAVEQLQGWWERVQEDGFQPGSPVMDRAREEALRLVSRVVPMAFGTLGVIGEVLLVVVLALFIAHNPGAYERGLLRLFPPDKEEDVASLLRSVAHVLRQWVKGVLLSMTFVGVLTGVGLRIVGVESWLALALLSMFGEFVPFLGPIATGVLGTAVALSQSPETAVRAAVVYLVVQQVETNLVVPLVMKQAVRIQPALLLVWQLVFVNAFGLLGLFIATPLLAALQTAIRIAYVQRALGRPAD